MGASRSLYVIAWSLAAACRGATPAGDSIASSAAAVTARTWGLAYLQANQLPQAEAEFENFWAGLPGGPPPAYPTGPDVLRDWCKDHEVRGALANSIAVLGELLRGFNEVIYKNFTEQNQPD